ncbi:hypothetical protein NBO_431g0003, partial [Nosema bombycis CQ1]
MPYQNDMPFQNDSVFGEELDSNSKFNKAGSKDAEDYELIDTILRSNESLNNNHNQDIIMLFTNSFKTDKQTDGKLNKTLGLLEIALALDKQKGDQYEKVLELFVDSMKKKELIEIDNQKILNYIKHVINPRARLDDATIKKLAKKHLKDKPLFFNRSKKSTSKTVVNQGSSQDLGTNSVSKKVRVHDRRAILAGELTDDTHGEDFKLIGKAIIERKLNLKAKKLLRKVLLSSKNKARRSLKKLIKLLKTRGIERNILQDGTQLQNDGAFSEEAPDSNSKLQIAGFDDADEFQIRIRIDTFLKRNESLKNNHNQAIITLLRKALVLGSPKDVDNKKILRLIGNSIKTGKPIEFDHKDIFKYLSDVYNAGSPLDKATIAKFAEIHKDKNTPFNFSKKPGSKTNFGQESSFALHNNSALEKNSFHDNSENQVSHIAKNSSSGGPNSVTVGQNEESETVKTKKSAKPKKQHKSRKRSCKIGLKSNSDLHKTKDKSKKSRKKSSKKLKG